MKNERRNGNGQPQDRCREGQSHPRNEAPRIGQAGLWGDPCKDLPQARHGPHQPEQRRGRDDHLEDEEPTLQPQSLQPRISLELLGIGVALGEKENNAPGHRVPISGWNGIPIDEGAENARRDDPLLLQGEQTLHDDKRCHQRTEAQRPRKEARTFEKFQHVVPF